VGGRTPREQRLWSLLFVAGRKLQAMLSAWRFWRKTEASIPGLRRGAYGAVATMFRFGVIAAVVIRSV
jgi:hypothetical protein